MSLFDLIIVRVLPLGVRRVLVGEVEVWDVPDVVVVAASPCFRDTEDDFLSRVVVNIPEDGPHAQVLCVFVHDFEVGRRPRDAWSFTKP